jgi:hypothetical protein
VTGGRGVRLFELVRSYADLGEHRTGTTADAATVDWFADELVARGAVVERRTFDFEQYSVDWEVAIDGEAVTSLPLFYQGVGNAETSAPARAAVDAFGLLVSGGDDVPATEGEVLVVATTGADGRLVVPNRKPLLRPGPFVLLIPGALADGIDDASITVRIEASMVDGRSANVLGRFGNSERPLVVATPLSGWFRCAGERGTGIALALDIASAIAPEHPVVVAGTSGHELVDLGLQRFLTGGRPDACAVLHIGASAAAAQSPTQPVELSTGRFARAAVPDQAGIAEALAPAGLTPTFIDADAARDPASWAGEAREWCGLGVPLVSLTGYFPLFHTPDDLPDAATSPQLLERVHDALVEAARVLA